MSSRVIGIALALAALATQAAGEEHFKLVAGTATVEPGKSIPEGELLTVRCPWSATNKNLSGTLHLPQGAASAEVSLVYNNGGKHPLKVVPVLIPPGFYPVDTPPKGEVKAEWLAKGAHPYLVTCRFMQKTEPAATAEVAITVTTSKKPESPAAHPATKMPFGVTAPPPKLEIVGVTWKVAQTCNPAQLLTATVKIRNTGKPLPPGRATLRAEQNSKYLSVPALASLDVFVPAIGTGDSVAVDAPLGAGGTPDKFQPLAGQKVWFYVNVKPTNPTAFAPPGKHPFYAVFPKDLCASHLSSPRTPTTAVPAPAVREAPKKR